MRKITTLYLHYSASGDLGGPQQSHDTIDGWHRARGWRNGFGYNGGTTPRGERIPGRPDWMVPAGVKYHNSNSLSFVCIGDDLKDTPWFPTDAQYEDAAAWCREEMAKHDVPLSNILGHRDSNLTACPGPFDVHGRLKRMLQQPQPEEDEMGMATRAATIKKGEVARCRTWIDKGANKTLWVNVSNLGSKDTTIRYFGWRNNGDFIKAVNVDLLPSQAKPDDKKMDGDDKDAVAFFGNGSSGITLEVECIKGGPVQVEWTKTL